jgi:trk system potassium uptake protein TrkH
VISLPRILGCLAYFAPIAVILTGVPFVYAGFAGSAATFQGLALPVVLTAGVGFMMRHRRIAEHTTAAESLLASLLIFAVSALLCVPAYLMSGLSFTDGVFESISGITSTGLSRFSNIEAEEAGIKFLRAWQQWVGGYAILVLLILFMPRNQSASEDLSDMDVEGGEDALHGRGLAWRVLLFYSVLTAVCWVLVRLTGIGWEPSLLLTLTAVSTGGFSVYNDSIGGLDTATVVMLFIFAFAGAFAFSRGVQPTRQAPFQLYAFAFVFAALVILWLGGSALVYLIEGGRLSVADAALNTLSAQTTTGFSTTDIGNLSPASKLVLSFSMLVGGDSGSTAGGIKIVRFVTLIFLLIGLKRLLPKQFESSNKQHLIGVTVAFLTTVVVGALVLWTQGAPVHDAVFEMVSAVATVGLSVGVSGGEAPVLSLWVLTFGMLLGRVEFLFLIVIVVDVFRNQQPSSSSDQKRSEHTSGAA